MLFDELQKTNKHETCKCKEPRKPDKLLADTVQLLSYSEDPADPTRNLLTLNLLVLQGDGNIKPHPSEDVVVG